MFFTFFEYPAPGAQKTRMVATIYVNIVWCRKFERFQSAHLDLAGGGSSEPNEPDMDQPVICL